MRFPILGIGVALYMFASYWPGSLPEVNTPEHAVSAVTAIAAVVDYVAPAHLQKGPSRLASH